MIIFVQKIKPIINSTTAVLESEEYVRDKVLFFYSVLLFFYYFLFHIHNNYFCDSYIPKLICQVAESSTYYIKEYDECFSYRFLSEARNIMQHGHYIVSVDSEGKFGFDFQQILSVPHFNIKKKMKGDMEHYQKLFNKITDPEKRGRLAFTYTIDKYCISLIRIYLGYYQLTKDYLHILIEQLHNIMANNPQLTLLGEEKKILMFRLDNDTHFLNIDRPYYEQFLTDMKEAEMFLAFLIKQTGDNTMKFINVEDE